MRNLGKASGMNQMNRGVCCLLAAMIVLAGFGQQTGAFFRIVAPTNTKIKAFDSRGYMTWTNAAPAGVTCIIQRASTLAGPSNWVDYVQHEATNATMAVRVHDPNPPASMALIPAGSFQMGDNLDGSSDARPVHTVYVGAFYMDKTPVTKANWDEVRAWGATHGYTDLPSGGGKASGHPVQIVNWYACVKWCNARSQKDGLTPVYYMEAGTTTVYRTGSVTNPCTWWAATGYRLPTEAEWEKAARGGLSGKRFPWGDRIDRTRANYIGHTAGTEYDDSDYDGFDTRYATGNYPYTSPVGTFVANGYGLYDMAGNVYEWCWDWYDSAYYGSSASFAPQGPSSSPGCYRVLRGGSWDSAAYACRAANRSRNSPSIINLNMGFRIVRRAQ